MKEDSQKSIQDANKWLNQNGRPSFTVLKSLVDQGTPEAMESLRQLAENYNLTFTRDTSPEELLDIINSAMKEDDDT